jgi:hypothetical protein
MVRSTTTFGRWAYVSSASGTAGSVTSSRYASSSTTSMSDGTAWRNLSSSALRRLVPVGLFGLQTMTSRVRSVIASAIAGRSWPCPGVLATRMLVAPTPAAMIG